MQKMLNKLASFVIALTMVLGVIAPSVSRAADEATQTDTVTLHKILMSKDALKKHDVNKEYDGKQIQNIQDFFDATAKEIPNVYFAVKNADGSKYVKEDGTETDNIDEALGGLTKDGVGLVLNTSKLKGTYQIVEVREKTTYKGEDQELLAGQKAVPINITLPLVNNNGIVKDAHVYPKNTQEKPRIDKNFATDAGLTEAEGFDPADAGAGVNVGANYDNYQKKKATAKAEIGKDVKYEVKTEIPELARYKSLVWNDAMTDGLTYNKDLVITGAGLTADDYEVFADDRGFEVKLKDTGLTKVENAAKTGAVELTLKYSAKVNSNSVVDIPEKNDISLEYSNKEKPKPEPKEGTPVDKKIEVKKTWGADGHNNVTEEDKDAVVVYTLQKKNGENWENVESVTKKYDAQNPDNSYNHTFENLEENGIYRVVERVSGYKKENTKFENGVTTYKNEKDNDNPKPLNPTEPAVVNGGRKFVKTNNEEKDSNKLERLTGATFYIKNGDQYLIASKKDEAAVKTAKKELDDAVAAYNNLKAEQQEGQEGTKAKELINAKQEAYNKAFIKNATGYTWGAKGDPNVVLVTSDAEGRFEISGLAYGKYELEEKDAPNGYAPLNGPVEFTVSKGSYVSTEAELQYNKANADKGYGLQIKNKKVSIPQTGGIGSIIFVVAGLMIMGLAAYKMKANKEQA